MPSFITSFYLPSENTTILINVKYLVVKSKCDCLIWSASDVTLFFALYWRATTPVLTSAKKINMTICPSTQTFVVKRDKFWIYTLNNPPEVIWKYFPMKAIMGWWGLFCPPVLNEWKQVVHMNQTYPRTLILATMRGLFSEHLRGIIDSLNLKFALPHSSVIRLIWSFSPYMRSELSQWPFVYGSPPSHRRHFF